MLENKKSTPAGTEVESKGVNISDIFEKAQTFSQDLNEEEKRIKFCEELLLAFKQMTLGEFQSFIPHLAESCHVKVDKKLVDVHLQFALDKKD